MSNINTTKNKEKDFDYNISFDDINLNENNKETADALKEIAKALKEQNNEELAKAIKLIAENLNLNIDTQTIANALISSNTDVIEYLRKLFHDNNFNQFISEIINKNVIHNRIMNSYFMKLFKFENDNWEILEVVETIKSFFAIRYRELYLYKERETTLYFTNKDNSKYMKLYITIYRTLKDYNINKSFLINNIETNVSNYEFSEFVENSELQQYIRSRDLNNMLIQLHVLRFYE